MIEPLIPSDAVFTPTEEAQASEFADILYLTGTARFWLLPQEVVDQLQETADELKSLLDRDSPGSIRHLADQLRLLDALEPLHMRHFLSQEKLQEFESIMQEWNLTADNFNFEPSSFQRFLEYQALGMVMEAEFDAALFEMEHERERYAARFRAADRLRTLYNEAKERAEGLGYTLNGANFYRPLTQGCEEAVRSYRTSRQGFIYHFNRLVKDQPELNLVEFVEQLKEALKWPRYVRNGGQPPPRPPRLALQAGSHYLAAVNHSLQAYLQAIAQLAELDIVTPELALSRHPDADEEINQGSRFFQDYHTLYQRAQALIDRLDEKVNSWVNSTGNTVQAPIFLFANERNAYREYLQEMQALYQKTQDLAAEHFPDKQLIWYEDLIPPVFNDPYTPQPLGHVVRPGFPLREYLLASNEPAPAYLSVQQLIKRASCDEKTQLRLALAQEMSFPGERPADEYAFGEWLRRRGAREVPLNMNWFDEQGRFRFEPSAPAFLNSSSNSLLGHLDQQGLRVDCLNDEAVRNRFQQSLQAWLQADQQRGRLINLDFSYATQIQRLAAWLQNPQLDPLDPRSRHQRDFPITREQTSDSSNNHEGLILPIETQARWHGAEGKITIPPVHFPDQETAINQPLIVRLTDANGEEVRERNLGSYSLKCSLSFSGYIGAKLSFKVDHFDPRSLKVDHETGHRRMRSSDNPTETTRSRGSNTKASFGELDPQVSIGGFLGLKMGTQLTTELNWLPPADLSEHLPYYASMLNMGVAQGVQLSNEEQEEQDLWRTLCRSQLMLEIGWGAGFSMDFQLVWRDGRFRIRLKAKSFFGVGIGGGIELELDLHQLDLWIAMINQALRDNNYQRLEWVDEESFGLLSRLSFLQVFLYVEVGLLMLRGADAVSSLYQTLTDSNRRYAGPIAHSIVTTLHQEQLKAWIQALPPEALGALLYTLSRRLSGFVVESDSQEEGQRFNADQARILQQQAIARCVGFLVQGAEADAGSERPAWSVENPLPQQWLFTKAVARRHPKGKKTTANSQEAYCINRARLDQFMSQNVESIRDSYIQGEIHTYHEHADLLGQMYQGQCLRLDEYLFRNMNLSRL